MSIKNTRIIAIILLCAMAVSLFVSCSGDKTPDGYQLIAKEGDQFRLYVPTQWISNTTGGITGATYSMSENVSVQVTVADDAAELSLDEYWNICDEKNKAELADYSWNGKKESTQLGGQLAHKYVYTATLTVRVSDSDNALQGVKYKFMQVMAKYKGDIYILLYSAPEESYDDHVGEVEGSDGDVGILGHFTFAEPYTSDDDDKKYSDKVVAPEGMKLISTESRPYRFFVPNSWIVNNSTEATAAYASADDSSNISVQLYMSDNDSQTVIDYWTMCQEGYEKIFDQYTLVSQKEVENADGLKGMQYEITVKMGKTEYRMIQAIFQKGVMFYIVTYTATTDENYNAHLSEVDQMIKNFSVRKAIN